MSTDTRTILQKATNAAKGKFPGATLDFLERDGSTIFREDSGETVFFIGPMGASIDDSTQWLKFSWTTGRLIDGN